MRTKGSSRIEFANTLRGYAALCVLVYHYGFIFWAYRDITAGLVNAPPLDATRYATPVYLHWIAAIQPFDLGAYGVALFFLISGFVIPFTFEKVRGRGFLFGRIMRIYPTYAVGFTFTLLFILACGTYFGLRFP